MSTSSLGAEPDVKGTKLRILVVSQYFWPENFRINDLVTGLSERGHEITVLTGQPNYPSGQFFEGYGWFKRTRERYHSAEIIRTPLIPRGAGGGIRLAVNYLSFAIFGSLIGPLRSRGTHDVIFVFAPSPILVCLPAIVIKAFNRTPLILWVQDLWPESLSATGSITSPRVLDAVKRMVRYIYRRCDLILAQSMAFLPAIVELDAHQDRVKYFPNSAESFYRPVVLESDAPERIGVPDGFRIVFAGNIGSAQDFPTILAAAEILKKQESIHWIILGEGRLATWVKDEVSRRGLQESVHLLGQHPVESMPRYFQLADVLLVTLKRDPIFSLTIPSKIQSYLACQKPIVAGLDGEGARVVQESGAGFSVPAESPEALASAVMKIYALTETERTDMGRRGRSYFDLHFERSMLTDRLEAWMRSLVAGDKP